MHIPITGIHFHNITARPSYPGRRSIPRDDRLRERQQPQLGFTNAQEKTMLTKSKLATVLAIAGLMMASPALAQSARSSDLSTSSQTQLTRHSFNNPGL